MSGPLVCDQFLLGKFQFTGKVQTSLCLNLLVNEAPIVLLHLPRMLRLLSLIVIVAFKCVVYVLLFDLMQQPIICVFSDPFTVEGLELKPLLLSDCFSTALFKQFKSVHLMG